MKKTRSRADKVSLSEQKVEKEESQYKENEPMPCNIQSLIDDRCDDSNIEMSPSFSFERDHVSGPLNKRSITPVPSITKAFVMSPARRPHNTWNTRTGLHVIPSAPLLRQSSSAFSVYSHHQHIHPQACLTTSCGRMLMSQPLLATPNAVMTPGSASHPWSLGYASSWQPSIDATKRDSVNGTPGLDLLAEQVVRNAHAAHPVVTLPRQHQTKQFRKAATGGTTFEPAGRMSESLSSLIDNGSHPGSHVRFSTYNHDFGQERSHEYSSALETRIHTIPFSSTKSHRFSAPSSYCPPRDPVSAYPDLFAKAPSTSKPCKCANSKCLKLYCECFRGGFLCDSNLCRCKECRNDAENNTRRGLREYAILKIIAKRPDAFHNVIKRRTGNWCKCQKNK